MKPTTTNAALRVLAKVLAAQRDRIYPVAHVFGGTEAARLGVPALRRAGLITTSLYYRNIGGRSGAYARRGTRVTGQTVFLTPTGMAVLGALVALCRTVAP